jgi:putative inorganic carbon (hco3(-)) transporter
MEKLLPDTNSSDANRVVPVLGKVIQVSLFTFVVFSMFSISVTQVSFTIGTLSWLLKAHLTRTWKELRGTWVGIAILCFCLAYILTIITSVDLANSLSLLKKFLQFIIFFWVANTVQDAKQRDLLVGLVIVAATIAAINGILPLIKPSICAPPIHYCGIRPIGTMSAPSTFSSILMIVGLLALGKLLFHKPKEYWLLGSLGIIGLCLLLSMTRQSWLGFFVGGVFLVFFLNKKYLLLLPLLLVVTLLFAPEKIRDRIHSFTNLKDSSLQARLSLWKGGWKTFRDHPVTGCGYKCVDSVYSQYPDPSGWIAHYRGMHSNIFQLLTDTGIAGLGAWIFIWVAYFIEIFKRWRALTEEKSQDNAAGILMGSSAAVTAFLVGGFFESSIYDSEVTMLVYFVMGISLAKVKKLPH